MWQLWPTTAIFFGQKSKVHARKKKRLRQNSKRFFINTIMSKWKRSGACACDPQYQPKVTCTPMWCVYVCWQGAGDPDNAFIMFFHHEINHAPMAFSRTKFSRRRRRYIRLVARDVDRFARLISAPNIQNVQNDTRSMHKHTFKHTSAF